MIIHVPQKSFIVKVRWRDIDSWRHFAAAARLHWDHGYITICGLVVSRW